MVRAQVIEQDSHGQMHLVAEGSDERWEHLYDRARFVKEWAERVECPLNEQGRQVCGYFIWPGKRALS